MTDVEILDDDIITATDSYKLTHWKQYPHGTEKVYSYFESRNGAAFPETVFYGLQYIIKKHLQGVVVTEEGIQQAKELAEIHFGTPDMFNEAGWRHILEEHGGKLPVRIKAAPEGLVVPVNQVLMTVENTCKHCYWLTNALESLLTHVWYPSTVATLSRTVKKEVAHYLELTSDDPAGALAFMLHDFGYRGATSHESAKIGGSGHLINFLGTDTVPAIKFAQKYYAGLLTELGFSVAATEHSIMTSLGPDGEPKVVKQLLEENPTGIVSCVGDSFDYYYFISEIVGKQFKEAILNREGRWVSRPDSTTDKHRTPEELVVWTLIQHWNDFGGTTNSKGFKVLDDHIRVLWGDGIDRVGILKIVVAVTAAGFSVENVIFGMGGGLIQKVNRDTQRFAFKSSAQCREGVWYDVYKRPIDLTKASKNGRLSLIEYERKLITIKEPNHKEDILQTVFEDGELLIETTFAEVRERAELKVLVEA